jgi:YD repeat-containing protein
MTRATRNDSSETSLVSSARLLQSHGFVRRSATALLLLVLAVNSYATSNCFQWRYAHMAVDTGWHSSQDAVFALMQSSCVEGSCGVPDLPNCSVAVVGAEFLTTTSPFPYDRRIKLRYAGVGGNCVGMQGLTDSQQPSVDSHPGGCKIFTSATPPPEPGLTCNAIGDPIDPASCSMYSTEVDIAGHQSSIEFKRFYNSRSLAGSGLSPGWRHSFSRSIKPKYSGSGHKTYVVHPDNSSLYTAESAACTSGFAEIKSRVSTWANATASYASGVCTLSVGSTPIGTLPLYYQSQPTPAPGTLVLIALNATRDDGQLVSFRVDGSSISAPPSIKLKLVQTGSGYALTDANDTVEAYDTAGKLLSTTSRAGVVQTIGYDSSGRLSTVMDSFGHSLTLTYDSQGRLSTVTRQ